MFNGRAYASAMQVEALLAERGRGEQLVLFEPASFADFPALVRFFNEEVCCTWLRIRCEAHF